MLLPDVEKWRLSALTDFATALASANNETFQVNIDKPRNFFANLGSSWQGAAYNAAYDRVDADHTQARRVWAYIDDLITEILSAASDIDSNRTVVLGKVADARGSGLTVADNWVVCEKDGVSAENIKAKQDAIDGALHPFNDAVEKARTKISEAAELVRGAGDLFGSDLDVGDAAAQGGRLGAEDGRAVADAVKNGDTAKLDEIGSRLPVAVLTPDQKQALIEGRDVPSLPAEVQDYYKEFFANAGRDGVLGLSDRLDARATAGPGHPVDTMAASQQQGLADGMLAVTNEHLGTGTGPDGKLISPGSYTNLPTDIRQLISGRVFDKTGGQIAGPDGIVKDIHQREQLANLVSKASPGTVGGKTFSMEVARQGASLARYLNESEKPLYGGHLPPDFGPDDKGKIEAAANRFLGVGERNHEADYQLLTGRDSNTGARIPNDLSFGSGGDEFHPAKGNYDPKEFARDVFGHTWDDRGRTASGLFDWAASNSHDEGSVGDLSRKMLTSLPEVFAPDHGKVDIQGTSFYN
ncbi:TPR repeat region-containing protein, partial [Nocardia sp. NPDC004722]